MQQPIDPVISNEDVIDLVARATSFGMTSEEMLALISSANRLGADARFLGQDGRYRSAYSLAILSLEEVGKLILRRWDHLGKPFPSNRSEHFQKQVAVVSVHIIHLVRDMIENLKEGPEGLDHFSAATEALSVIKERESWRGGLAVAEGMLDRLKQGGFYEDGDRSFQLPPEEDQAELLDAILNVASLAATGAADTFSPIHAIGMRDILAGSRWSSRKRPNDGKR
jgi:AbiV family abortive infection protein